MTLGKVHVGVLGPRAGSPRDPSEAQQGSLGDPAAASGQVLAQRGKAARPRRLSRVERYSRRAGSRHPASCLPGWLPAGHRRTQPSSHPASASRQLCELRPVPPPICKARPTSAGAQGPREEEVWGEEGCAGGLPPVSACSSGPHWGSEGWATEGTPQPSPDPPQARGWGTKAHASTAGRQWGPRGGKMGWTSARARRGSPWVPAGLPRPASAPRSWPCRPGPAFPPLPPAARAGV